MNARDMFFKLKYKKYEFENGTIQYEKAKKDKVSRVRFYMKDKVYSAYYAKLYEDGIERQQYTRIINTDLHQAINKQMKELGWLNE